MSQEFGGFGGGFAAKMNKTQINPKFNLFCGSLPCEKSFLFFSVLFQERKHCKVAPRYCHQMAPKRFPCAALRDPQKSSEKAECDSLWGNKFGLLSDENAYIEKPPGVFCRWSNTSAVFIHSISCCGLSRCWKRSPADRMFPPVEGNLLKWNEVS